MESAGLELGRTLLLRTHRLAQRALNQLSYQDRLDSILLDRLNHSFGVEDVALRWMASYLERRSQFVRFCESVSSTAHVSAGVPQGSVLGTAYFIVYTADYFKSFMTPVSM